MNYELALRLKKAGFPQKYVSFGAGFGEENVYAPTLEELISECGKEFRWLKNNKTSWLAQQRQHPVHLGDIKSVGHTPEEAVANLWLALNEKK